MLWVISSLVKIVLTIVPLLVGRAFRTVAERKIRSSIQRRQGPAVVGRYGLLQPFADAIKLLTKETVVPSSANNLRFRIAPRVTFTLSLLAWAVRPLGDGIVLADVNLGRLYLLRISSLGVYGIVRAGWASNSKYPFLGALRSAAQRVSYEVSIGFILVSVLLCAGSSNLSLIVEGQREVYYRWPLLPRFLRFFVSVLAETNRHPFDLPEAEAELVSGYNVEYSAAGFVLFFLGEYVNRILRSRLTAILFVGGWLPPLDVAPFNYVPGPVWLGIKTTFFLVLFIYARAAYPRYRYDQLRRLGWKVFLPVSRAWAVFTAGRLVGRDGLPGV